MRENVVNKKLEAGSVLTSRRLFVSMDGLIATMPEHNLSAC